MRYVQARVEETRRERAYRIYVTDGIKVLCGFEARYADVVRNTEIKEDRTPEQIIDGVKNTLAAMKGR